jgi:protein TonB
MDTLLSSGEQLERELATAGEPVLAPAAGSLLLHCGLAGALLLYGFLGGLFHHNSWGSSGGGGAIQVNLTSALPLPSDQPPNENVLSTETPSQAPAEATPKTKQAVDETAIPISGKQKETEMQNRRRLLLQQQVADNRARYGEQAGSSMARAVQTQGYSSGQTTVSDSGFGSRFPWYVDNLNRKMAANWYKAEVTPTTRKGARAYIQFAIHRDGSVSNVQMMQPSGYSTLDISCQRAAQRVGNFDVLPREYNQNTLMTSFYCEY